MIHIPRYVIDKFFPSISDDGILQESRLSTLEDLQEALELEKRKNLDLSSVLQKEHNRVTMMASSLQQERRHLVEENDRELANIAQMQAVIDSLQVSVFSGISYCHLNGSFTGIHLKMRM